MATVNSGAMLSADDLNDMDRWILSYLSEHEWATPNLLRAVHNEGLNDEDRVSRQWISSRITRLEEHNHVAKVHPKAAERYLVDDPREN